MDLGKIKIDSKRLEAGEWVNEIPGLGDIELRVRGGSSIAYREALAKLQRAVTPEERNKDNSLPIAVADRITQLAAARALLVDWRNVEENGAPVPFSVETAERYLTDNDYTLFLDGVIYAAARVSQRAMEIDEAIAKN